MLHVKRIRFVIFAGLLAVLCTCTWLLLNMEQNQCMGVPIVAEDFVEKLTEDPALDISELQFNGIKIGSGEELTTIYISQPTEVLTDSSRLHGKLTVSDSGLSLYFLQNYVMKDLESAVSRGNPLFLVITDGNAYRRIKVVLTTLPVMYIEQTSPDTFADAQGREVKTGSFMLMGKTDSSDIGYRVESGMTQWHIRGHSSSYSSKPPLKLSLKDKNGNNADHDLLQLGADDDWILNALNKEDTKVREKFAMDFWNQYLAEDAAERMSTGEYVEVIEDNSYRGLHLLQRRIDQKYLQLDRETDILFKGSNTWSMDSMEQSYEIIYSPYSQEDTYQILSDVVTWQNGSRIDLDSFIKLELFIDFLSAGDNADYKNIFYVLQKEGDHYVMRFVPWDTDLSMGITWMDGIVFDFYTALEARIKYREYENVKQHYPQLDQMLADHWQKARRQIYTAENIHDILNAQIDLICNGGAYSREMQFEGLQYEGMDSFDALLTWCEIRLGIMDARYVK